MPSASSTPKVLVSIVVVGVAAGLLGILLNHVVKNMDCWWLAADSAGKLSFRRGFRWIN